MSSSTRGTAANAGVHRDGTCVSVEAVISRSRFCLRDRAGLDRHYLWLIAGMTKQKKIKIQVTGSRNAAVHSGACGTGEAERRLVQPEQTKHGQTWKFKFKQCGVFARRAQAVTAVRESSQLDRVQSSCER